MKRPVVIFFLWLLPLISLAQVDTVFWFVAPEVTNDHADRPINLVVSSTQDITPTNVTISMPRQPAFTPINITLTGFETHLEDLEARINLIEAITPGIVDNKGILIRADAPITAYYEVDPSNNRDIFSLKGDNALGYEFFCPAQNTYNNHDDGWAAPARNRIDIVATENGTIVEVYITAAANGQAAGSTITTPIMQAGQTYSIVADDEAAGNHLGGSHVTSNNKLIAVTISDDSVDDPGASHYDLLGDQLVPIQTPGAGGEYTIGQEFIVIKTRLSIDEHYYIVATDGATNIEVDGVNIGTINTGTTQAVIISGDTDYISCDKRVYLFHVGGFQREMGGALLPTIDGCKGSTRVSFTRTSSAPFYINLLVEGDATDAFFMEYEDGSVYQIPQGNFTQVPNTPVGEEWYYLDRGLNDFPDAQSPGVPDGEVTTIYNTETIFQMGLYNGTSSTGCKYGYFSDFKTNESSAVASGTNSDLIELCYGDSTFIRATGGINYQWSSTTCTDCMFGDLTKESIKVKPPSGSHVFFVEITNPCKSDPDTAKVTVNVDSLIQAYYTTSDPLVACDSISVATINNTIGERDGFQWILDGAAYSTDVEPILNYKNTGTEPDTIPITLAAYRYLCADAFTRQAIIYPAVNADFEPIDTAGCSPFLVPFNNTTTTIGNTYKWNFDDGNLAFTENPQNTFTNNTTGDLLFDVSMVATSTYNCKDTANQQVTVFPPVLADFFINKTSGCAPLEVNVTNLSSMATIDSVQWVWGDGDTSFVDNPATHTYQNKTAGNLLHTLKLEVFSNNGCSHIETVDIVVYPQVSAGFDQDLIDICHNTLVTFQDTSIGSIVSKKWNFSDGTVFNNVGDTTHIFQNFSNGDSVFTVYQIVQGAAGCSDTATIDINVHPGVFAGFSTNKTKGCADLDISFLDQSLGPVTAYEWNWGDGAPVEVGTGPHNHTYTNGTSNSLFHTSQQVVFNAAGCSDTIQKQIEVYPEVDATFTAAPLSGCNPLTVNFAHTPSNLVNVSRTWDFDDNSSSSALAPVHIFEHFESTDSIFNVELAVQSAKGCTDTFTTAITVAPHIDISFTIDTAKGCSPLTIKPQNTSSGGIDSWEWLKEDISLSNNQNPGSFTFFNNSNAPIDTTLILVGTNNGGTCTDTAYKTITIYPSVDATFTAIPTQGCNPLTVVFQNTPATLTPTTKKWDFGDNTSGTGLNQTHIFEHFNSITTPYEVELSVKSAYGCVDTTSQTINVYPHIDLAFSLDTAQGCSPFSISPQNNSSGGIDAWIWQKEDIVISNSQSPGTFTFYNNGNSPIDTTIYLIGSNNGGSCADTISKEITIFPSVDATFTATPTSGCNPLLVDFNHTPSNTVPVTKDWDFGDFTSANGASPEHLYQHFNSTSTPFNVQLAVKSGNGCKDTSYQTITVNPYINASFTLDTAKGCSPFTIYPENTSIGGFDSWTWKKENIVISNNANPGGITLYNTTDSPIDTTITLIGTNGAGTCIDSIQREITIYPAVYANFTQDIESGCNPLTVEFTHTPPNNPSVSYFWDFDDLNSSSTANPVHTFENSNPSPRIYDVQLTVISPYNCIDSFANSITVGSYFDARMQVSKVSGCSPFQVAFADISDGDVSARTWYRNGVSFSSQANPQLIFTNTSGVVRYDTIMMVARSTNSFSCFDTARKVIAVYPELDPTFTHLITEGCNPLTVNFSHAASNYDYFWNFGDNSSSNLENPSHIFNNDLETKRIYDIKLVVESEYGCKDSAFSQVTVASRLNAEFTMPGAAGCSPKTFNFTDASEGDIATYRWYINGNLSSSTNIANTTLVNTTNNNLIQDVKLVVTNTGPGICVDSITKQITAYPEVTANFTMDTDRGCNPLPVNFTYTPGGNTVNVNFDWEFGDNTSSDEQDPLHTFEHFNYNGTSSFQVNLKTTSEYGCVDEHEETIIVEKALKAEFTTNPSAGCNPFNAEFINVSKGAQNYQWTYGDGASFNINSPQNVSHEYTNQSFANTANYIAKLVVTNTNGLCSDSMQQPITVYPLINSSFTASILEDCHPVEVSFTNLSQGVSTYFWDFADETNSSETNPVHTFRNTSNTQDKNFNVTLYTENDYECTDDTTITIRVNHNPRSQFTIDQTTSCSPLHILAQNTSIGFDSYEWRTGDGQTSGGNPLNYTYNNTTGQEQSFKLELYTETNRNCNDSSSLVLNVYPNVVADFNISDPEGCNPLFTDFENLSINTDNYFWDFGNGTTSNQTNPSKRFGITGYENEIIPIKLIASSAFDCVDSITKNVTVYVQPSAEFEADPIIQQWPENTVTITDLTNGGPFNYAWNFDDGQTDNVTNSTSHNYDTWGDYEISLIVTNSSYDNCIDTATETITIDPPEVIANFSISDTAGCVPHTVTFEAESSTHAGENYNYYWDFGDETTSSEQAPTKEYSSAGIYIVTLTVEGENGFMFTTGKITVYPKPEVDFAMEPRFLQIPGDYAQCYNLTPFPTQNSFYWDFGDGSTSTEINPTQYYTSQGLYSVTLTATSTNGCDSSLTRENYIQVEGKGNLKFPNAFTPSLAGSSGGAYDPYSSNNDIFFPIAEGVIEYKLLIYNRWGELMFQSDDVNIGWDGYYNGKICPQDVYIWKVEGKFKNGNTFEETGDVTLLR